MEYVGYWWTFYLGWLFIWPMCYWFGLSPNDLPLAPDAATSSLTRIMALSRWIVECVSYVSGETLESLILSNSLSLLSADLNLSLCLPFLLRWIFHHSWVISHGFFSDWTSVSGGEGNCFGCWVLWRTRVWCVRFLAWDCVRCFHIPCGWVVGCCFLQWEIDL